MAAATNDSPEHFRQMWSVWAENKNIRLSEDSEPYESFYRQREGGEVTRLNRKDMALYGHYPAWDEFIIIVCKLCQKRTVRKLQCLSCHIEDCHPTEYGNLMRANYRAPRLCDSAASSSTRLNFSHQNSTSGVFERTTENNVSRLNDFVSQNTPMGSRIVNSQNHNPPSRENTHFTTLTGGGPSHSVSVPSLPANSSFLAWDMSHKREQPVSMVKKMQTNSAIDTKRKKEQSKKAQSQQTPVIASVPPVACAASPASCTNYIFTSPAMHSSAAVYANKLSSDVTMISHGQHTASAAVNYSGQSVSKTALCSGQPVTREVISQTINKKVWSGPNFSAASMNPKSQQSNTIATVVSQHVTGTAISYSAQPALKTVTAACSFPPVCRSDVSQTIGKKNVVWSGNSPSVIPNSQQLQSMPTIITQTRTSDVQAVKMPCSSPATGATVTPISVIPQTEIKENTSLPNSLSSSSQLNCTASTSSISSEISDLSSSDLEPECSLGTAGSHSDQEEMNTEDSTTDHSCSSEEDSDDETGSFEIQYDQKDAGSTDISDENGGETKMPIQEKDQRQSVIQCEKERLNSMDILFEDENPNLIDTHSDGKTFLNHEPKPISVCTFGLRRSHRGNIFCDRNRKSELIEKSFQTHPYQKSFNLMKKTHCDSSVRKLTPLLDTCEYFESSNKSSQPVKINASVAVQSNDSPSPINIDITSPPNIIQDQVSSQSSVVSEVKMLHPVNTEKVEIASLQSVVIGEKVVVSPVIEIEEVQTCVLPAAVVTEKSQIKDASFETAVMVNEESQSSSSINVPVSTAVSETDEVAVTTLSSTVSISSLRYSELDVAKSKEKNSASRKSRPNKRIRTSVGFSNGSEPLELDQMSATNISVQPQSLPINYALEKTSLSSLQQNCKVLHEQHNSHSQKQTGTIKVQLGSVSAVMPKSQNPNSWNGQHITNSTQEPYGQPNVLLQLSNPIEHGNNRKSSISLSNHQNSLPKGRVNAKTKTRQEPKSVEATDNHLYHNQYRGAVSSPMTTKTGNYSSLGLNQSLVAGGPSVLYNSGSVQAPLPAHNGVNLTGTFNNWHPEKKNDCDNVAPVGLPMSIHGYGGSPTSHQFPLTLRRVEREVIRPAPSVMEIENRSAMQGLQSLFGSSTVIDVKLRQPKPRHPSKNEMAASGQAVTSRPLPMLMPTLGTVCRLIPDIPAEIIKKNGMTSKGSSYSFD